jgi:hypothetical protein
METRSLEGPNLVVMEEDRRRQPERADYGEASEPHCPVCGETLIVDLDEETPMTAFRCPKGHTEDPLIEAKIEPRTRERVGEQGEDS